MASTNILGRRAPASISLVAPSPVDTQLGELLHGDGTLTEQDIQLIFAAQLESGERFGEAASRLGLLSEQDVQRALARQAEFPLLTFGKSALSARVDRCVSAPQQACGRVADLAQRVGVALVRARQSGARSGGGQAGPRLQRARRQSGRDHCAARRADAARRCQSSRAEAARAFRTYHQVRSGRFHRGSRGFRQGGHGRAGFQLFVGDVCRGPAGEPAGTARPGFLRLSCWKRRPQNSMSSSSTPRRCSSVPMRGSLQPAREAWCSRPSVIEPAWGTPGGSSRTFNRPGRCCSAP